jgi:DNA-binding MarR family transcriptional regulator/GNAT superfamily N-acetyltransferase
VKDSSELEMLSILRKITQSLDLCSKDLESKIGLSLPQILVLKELQNSDRVSLSELAFKNHLSSATLSGIIERLEDKKLIIKSKNSTDKRSFELKLTTRGKQLVQKSGTILGVQFEEELAQLKDWEKTSMFASLQRVADMIGSKKDSKITKAKKEPEIIWETTLGDGSTCKILKIESYDMLPQTIEPDSLAEFIMECLQPFEDTFEDTKRGIDDAIGSQPCKGGFILLAMRNEKLAGAMVMLETRMKGYIPEKCLLFIGVDAKLRGLGIGKHLLDLTTKIAGGNIYLHVEYANVRAQKLYERMGFVNRYAEMRFYKKDH